MDVLPHRYPFLLVDRVLEIEAGKRLAATKNVTFNEPFFPGHFPGHPVMPGVLIIEAMAQAGGILLLHDREDREQHLVYFTGIERARFRQPVVPGDTVRFDIDVIRLRRNVGKLSATATVDGKVVAEGILSSAMVPR